eukprot:scaffold311180_cov54-Attheya_sp.AAC.2
MSAPVGTHPPRPARHPTVYSIGRHYCPTIRHEVSARPQSLPKENKRCSVIELATAPSNITQQQTTYSI